MDRPSELIRILGLQPHPEGGWYAEAHRSPAPAGGRSPVTSIYFLLTSGQKSRWHRIDADEVWHFYEGAPLELLWSTDLRRCTRVHLGPVEGDHRPVAVVPPGSWQAARSAGAYTLVGCTVAPGFEFARFRLLADDAAGRDLLEGAPPELVRFL